MKKLVANGYVSTKFFPFPKWVVQQWLRFTNADTTKENDQIQQKKFKYHKPRVDSETQAR